MIPQRKPRRNPPVVIWSPSTPCLECGLPALQHEITEEPLLILPSSMRARHEMVYWQPRWAVINLKTGVCTLCNDGMVIGASDLCSWCLASYWKTRPEIAKLYEDRGEVLVGRG